MGFRLSNFDYSRPYFYMVTAQRLEGFQPLSSIVAPGRCQMSDITKAFVYVLRHYHERVPAIEPIECFSIMPDHLHMLIKIAGQCESGTLNFSSAGIPLPLIVEGILAALSRAYWEVLAKAGNPEAKLVVSASRQKTKSFAFPPVFAPAWHDWIVKKEEQLAAFTRYIRENPERSWRRKTHRVYFQRVSEIAFLGRKWYGYGNDQLLGLPYLMPMIYSRQIKDFMPEWSAAVEAAGRIGPGGAGVGTFMSPLEKACGHAIGLAGGRWVVLSPEGFSERWHPGRKYEPHCADGRMLFLSLYPAMDREPTDAELYRRCHEMGAIVTQGLSHTIN